MLEDFEGMICHADDILVYNRNKQEQALRLHHMLKRVLQETLVPSEKCEFEKKVRFMAKVCKKRIRAQPKLVRSI